MWILFNQCKDVFLPFSSLFLALFLPDKGGFLLNITQNASANSGFHNEDIYVILRVFYSDGGELFTHITLYIQSSPSRSAASHPLDETILSESRRVRRRRGLGNA